MKNGNEGTDDSATHGSVTPCQWEEIGKFEPR